MNRGEQTMSSVARDAGDGTAAILHVRRALLSDSSGYCATHRRQRRGQGGLSGDSLFESGEELSDAAERYLALIPDQTLGHAGRSFVDLVHWYGGDVRGV